MCRQFQGLYYSEVQVTNTPNSLLLTGLLEGREGTAVFRLPVSCVLKRGEV